MTLQITHDHDLKSHVMILFGKSYWEPAELFQKSIETYTCHFIVTKVLEAYQPYGFIRVYVPTRSDYNYETKAEYRDMDPTHFYIDKPA